jgi:hypothetical protein
VTIYMKSCSILVLAAGVSFDSADLQVESRSEMLPKGGIVALGWQEAECYVLPVNGDQVIAMSVAVEENLRRKDLTEVEKAVMLAELEELKRKQYGSARRGERTDLTSPNFSEVWTQDKTAKVLNVSRPTVSRNLKIARAIKEYPDLASYAKGAPVLKEYTRCKG